MFWYLEIKVYFDRAWLYDVCRGIEHEPVSARQLPKSIGCSKNFPGKTCLDTKEKVHVIYIIRLSCCKIKKLLINQVLHT